jgi:hypothetical protein
MYKFVSELKNGNKGTMINIETYLFDFKPIGIQLNSFKVNIFLFFVRR